MSESESQGHDRMSCSQEETNNATKLIQKETASEEASRKINIPFTVIYDNLKKMYHPAQPIPKQKRKRKYIFTAQQEVEIIDQIKLLTVSPRCTKMQIRNMIYEYAVRNNVGHNFSTCHQLAGKEWTNRFLQRNGLSLPSCTPTKPNQNYGGSQVPIIKVFTAEQEAMITEQVKKLASFPYGCSATQLRKMAYECAVVNNINHTFNQSTKLAGMGWLHAFIKRNNLMITRSGGAILIKPKIETGLNDNARPVPPLIPFQEHVAAGCEDKCMLSSKTMSGNMQNREELDKLKRRLIRSVARLIKEKKTEDEVWDELKKECGKNCKTLWARMRSLTLKKLKRLLDAEDRNDAVPSVARMTLTDWLLYDLVLVHEKIDVINRGSSAESKVLSNLFALVQRYHVEGRSGDDLADAWTAATVTYNHKGHQCSPMLMQRRWYQIKELTRHKLYQFWFTYRGNERLLINAKQDPPTALQRAIALRYPELITKQFPTWEESLTQGLVIKPEEFEIKMRKKELMKPCDEAVPDVVIVEQKIDTITLDSESDFDDDSDAGDLGLQDVEENDDSSQTPIIVQVKTEPEDPYDNISITEHPLYPEETKDRFQDALERLEMEENTIAMSQVTSEGSSQVEDCVMPLITNVTGAVEEIVTSHDLNIEDNNMEVYLENRAHVNTGADEESQSVINNFDDNSQESIVIEDDDDITPTVDEEENGSNDSTRNQIENNVIDITSPKAKRGSKNTDCPSHSNNIFPIITAIASGSQVRAKMEMNTDITNQENTDEEMSENSSVEDIINNKVESEKVSNLLMNNEAVTEMDIACNEYSIISKLNNLEFADDGIEYHEESYVPNRMNGTTIKENTAHENAGTPKFDLKLLMDPIVYTTKLEDMKVYKGRSVFDTIDGKQLIENITLESKPISVKSINVDQTIADDQNIEESKDNIQAKVENSDECDNDLFQNESSNESSSENLQSLLRGDSKRVKLSSSLLQKPRSRSYNPIQLCKNPDFNTRLKRLTVGFFSSERNRVFLKACKPMTIDLSKAFESKLVDGTMYLKPSDAIVKKEVDVSESAVSITPSAVPVQSLMDTPDIDQILQTELKKRMSERNTTIKLPNMSLVRQINQQLLMAEVAPLTCVTKVEKSSGEVINVSNNGNTIEENNSINTQAKKTTSETPTNPVRQPSPVINSNNSKKATPTNMPLLPMANNDKSKDGKIEKQKKKYDRSNMQLPLWVTKNTISETRPYSDSLLTIDTLYKVLNALDPASVDYRPKTKPNHNKIGHPRPGRPLGSRVDTCSNTVTLNFDSQTEKPPTNPPPTTKGKGDVPELAKKHRSCCWARARINKLKGIHLARYYKHKCPVSVCRCCCKEILRQTEINREIKLLERMMETDNFEETIEHVVKQSATPSNVELIPEVAQLGSPPTKQDVDLSNVIMSSVAHIRHPRPIHLHSMPQPTQKSNNISVGIQVDVDDDNVSIINDTEDTEPQKNIDNVTSVPKNDTEVTIDLVNDDNDSPSVIHTPKPKIRVHPANYQMYQTLNKPNDPIKTAQAKNSTTLSLAAATPPPPLIRAISPLPALVPSLQAVKLKNVSVNSPLAKVATLSPKESDKAVVSSPPCSCRPNVAMDKQSAMLVVDGSNDCPKHTNSRISTRIYLNRKHMAVAERPFYVGKNKILLTNIIPPAPQVTTPPVPPLSLELPEGVQVVMLSDGTISYLVDPGVILTPEQINTMPDILNVLQHQMKATGVTLPKNCLPTQDAKAELSNSSDGSKTIDSTSDNENKNFNMNDQNSINNTVNEKLSCNADTAQTELQQEANQELSNETSIVLEDQIEVQNQEVSEISTVGNSCPSTDTFGKQNTVMNEVETESSVCAEPATNVDNTGAGTEDNFLESLVENDLVQIPESGDKNTAINENTNNTASSASRNLLSDLMEMSGILEEDVTPPPTQQQPTNTTPESPQPLSVDTTQDCSMQSDSISDVPLSPTIQEHLRSAQGNDDIKNLTAITSFSELKYACDNNGLFYKLDLGTGTMVRINVCIQKTPELSSLKNALPTEVIDLTDEHNFTIGENSSGTNTEVKINSRLRPVKVSKPSKNASAQKLKLKDLSKMLPQQQPRPRGRPPRAKCINSDSQSEDEEYVPYMPISSTEERRPRPRGRPPKNKSISTESLSENEECIPIMPKPSTEERQPRPRGRPPKFTKSILINNQSDATEEVPSTSSEPSTSLLNRLTNNLKPLKIQLERRSSANILRRKTLSHNSTSILKRISNLKDTVKTTEDLLDDSSDDSDDEPLAKIAKKTDPQESDESTDAPKSEGEPQGEKTEDNLDFEYAIDAKKVEPPKILRVLLGDSKLVPVPTQLLSGAAIEQPSPIMMNNSLSFAKNESDDEDTEEDCILGV